MADLFLLPWSTSIKPLALTLCLVSPLLEFAFVLTLPTASDFIDSFARLLILHEILIGLLLILNSQWIARLLYPLTFLSERVAQALITYLNLAITLLLIA